MENEVKKDSVETVESIEPSESKNIVAIVGFILSWFLIVIPIILCIVGLKKYKTTCKGKRFSIWGIIIVIVRVILISLWIYGGVYLIKNYDDAADSFCTAIQEDKEACSKNEDGTYKCFFTNCDFDNVIGDNYYEYDGEDKEAAIDFDNQCSEMIGSLDISDDHNIYCVFDLNTDSRYVIYKDNNIIQKYTFDSNYNYTNVNNTHSTNVEVNNELTSEFNKASSSVDKDNLYHSDGSFAYWVRYGED